MTKKKIPSEMFELTEIKQKIKDCIRVNEKALLEENMLKYYLAGVQLKDTQCHYFLAKFLLFKSTTVQLSKEEYLKLFSLLSYCVQKDYNSLICKEEMVNLFLAQYKLFKNQTEEVFSFLEDLQCAGKSLYAYLFTKGIKLFSNKQLKFLIDKMLKESKSEKCSPETFLFLGKCYLGLCDSNKLIKRNLELGFEYIKRVAKASPEGFDICFSLFVVGSQVFLQDKENIIPPDLNQAYALIEDIKISPYEKLFLKNEVAIFGRYKYKSEGLKYLHKILDLQNGLKYLCKMNFLRPINLGLDTYSTLAMCFDFQTENENVYELVKKQGIELLNRYKTTGNLIEFQGAKLLIESYNLSFYIEVGDLLDELKELQEIIEKEKRLFSVENYLLFAENCGWELDVKLPNSKVKQDFSLHVKRFINGNKIEESSISYLFYMTYLKIINSYKNLLKEYQKRYSYQFTSIVRLYDDNPKYLNDLIVEVELDDEKTQSVIKLLKGLDYKELDMLCKILSRFCLVNFEEITKEVKQGLASVLEFININKI